MSYPNGQINEVSATPNGDVYDTQYQRWVPAPRELVSPDGSRYAYWSLSSTKPDNTQVHVVDVASGGDRIVYDGATNYAPFAFAADGIYLVHAINLKQSAFEGLFRIDLSGGTPARVPGAELRPQADWTIVGDGSAWGVTQLAGSQQIQYVVEQLDLAKGTVTDWLQEPPNFQLKPVGLDAQARLYLSDYYELWRLDAPNVEERLLNPPRISGQDSLDIFVADSHGEWMGTWGGVWHYSDADGARQLPVATDQSMVVPAGPCA